MTNGKIEFLRDPDTGHVYAYRDGKLIGPIDAMDEDAPAEPSHNLWEEVHDNG